MKPRLTLVTHVDWGHIRQRPQQLAAALTAHYDVHVLAPVARHRRTLQDNAIENVPVHPVWRLPGSYRSVRMLGLNARAARLQSASAVSRADAVVVTSPELFDWLGSSLGTRTLVYDCPDDALAFAQDGAVRDAKASIERRLLARADVIACASDELARRMRERGAAASRTIVVRNGWDPVAFPVAESRPLPAARPLRLAYFGTLGPWLDMEALHAMLAAADGATLRLIGPTDGIAIAPRPGLSLSAPLPHDALAEAVDEIDVMLLPFRVDALVRGVDPVKLYEYVALGKPILSAYWPALDPFSGFVTFYRSTGELCERVAKRSIDPAPTAAARRAFLEPQSWEMRATQLASAIASARDRGR